MVDARTFQALSDPTRLKILSLLGAGSMNVSDMVERLDITQPAVSRHLKVLREAGLIVDSRRGKWVEYSCNPSTVAEAAEYLRELNRARRGSGATPAGRRKSEPAPRPRGRGRRADARAEAGGPATSRYLVARDGDFIDDIML